MNTHGPRLLLTCLVAAAGAGCVEEPPDLSSQASSLTLENGLQINGLHSNGLYLNGLALNSMAPNGLAANGLPLNGLPLNGLSVNGLALNGIGANGLPLNGLPLNGLYVNGLPLNGLPLNGLPLNGLYLNGLPLNGMFINGLPLNGLGLNGLPLNGLFVDGMALGGVRPANALYVNGAPLTAVALAGLRINGATAATAIQIADPAGNLVRLTSAQETQLGAVMSHLVKCSLAAGDSLTIYGSSGAPVVYPGGHGLATTWKSSGLGPANPSAVDSAERVRWCLEHYRKTDTRNAVYPGLALNSQQLAQARTVFKYAVECALAPGDSVTINFPLATGTEAVVFSGALGLAPTWKTSALPLAGQQIVSACLAARTNALGNTVRISLRNSAYAGLSTTAVERKQFGHHEGAFWGNVFGAAPAINACAKDGGGPSGRVCTTGSCGFAISACPTSCGARDADGNYTTCGGQGQVLNTFLMLEPPITGGKGSTCAKRNDGRLWCWGSNTSGELGDGTQSPGRATPAPVSSALVGEIGQFSAGDHTCSRQKDGQLWCWGANQTGQVGDGTTALRYTPVRVTTLGNTAAKVSSTGLLGTCALKMDGTAWCWGYNPLYGVSFTQFDQVPTQVASLGNQVIDIRTGGYVICALKLDGTLWCWGDNYFGQLGVGDTVTRMAPTQVTALGNQVVDVRLDGGATCALKADGTLWCWGYNGNGQLGVGDTVKRVVPTQVTALGNQVTSMATGTSHTCALKADKTVWCWGDNTYGQVGDGTTEQRNLPVAVALPSAVKAITAGAYHNQAILENGAAFTWGQNSQGALGAGSTAAWEATPQRMTVLRLLGNGVCDLTESSAYDPGEGCL